MSAIWIRSGAGLAALVTCASLAADAGAYCSSCGTGGAVAYAQPMTYQAAYAPVAYTANYGSGSGWWPGCCLGNLFGWGRQPTYAVSYAPAYAVSYAPAYSSCSTCAPCTSCYAPCSSCVQQVTMQPVCTSSCGDCGSCSSCSGCATCGTSTVSQAVYQQPGCSSCGNGSAVIVPSQSGTTTVIQGGTVPGGQAPPSSNGSTEPQPMLAPGENPAGERQTFDTMRPSGTNGIQPMPTDDTSSPETAPSDGNGSANYFEAPQLFNPKDRTAARVAAPVRHAVYERSVGYRAVSTGRITAAQAHDDAVGWSSASDAR